MPHAHSHGGTNTARRVGISIILTFAFVIAEGIASYFSHSLALLSDAGHNLADALALVFSWYALLVARRPANARRTFGYHRVGILAALVNAVSLILIAAFIFWEAYERFLTPEEVQSGPMIVVALVAVLINGAISFWLHGEAKHDLNIRSAYLHMLGDALSALGVVVAGAYIAWTGNSIADPIVSILIGILILWSSWGIFIESIEILLEAAPKDLDMAALELTISELPGVLNVHDLHVWTVASGIISCSCHIVVPEQSIRSGQRVIQIAAETLKGRFGINHTTIQIEVEGCEQDEMYCEMRPSTGSCRHEH
jgi:cobalt-zinc-cadmium efflux system protein